MCFIELLDMLQRYIYLTKIICERDQLVCCSGGSGCQIYVAFILEETFVLIFVNGTDLLTR